MEEISSREFYEIEDMTEIASRYQDLAEFDNPYLKLYWCRDTGIFYMEYYNGDQDYYQLDDNDVAEVKKDSRKFLMQQAEEMADNEEGSEQIERYGWNLDTPDGDEIDDDYAGDCRILSYTEYYGPHVEIGWVSFNNLEGEKIGDEDIYDYSVNDALLTSDIDQATVFSASIAKEWVEGSEGGVKCLEHNQVAPTRYIITAAE
ncbi:MAG: hypothetical protein HQK96_17860 [Nitrospirae bacterium]|nr:hypothetical protein [Nitrospirota bacterium]